MRAKQLIGEFLAFTLVEPVLTVALALFGIVVFLFRAFWAVVLFVLGFAWFGVTVLELMVRSEHGLAMWFVMGGVFLAGLVAKRLATFPVKKACDFTLNGGSRRRRQQDAQFLPPSLPAGATIRLAPRAAARI